MFPHRSFYGFPISRISEAWDRRTADRHLPIMQRDRAIKCSKKQKEAELSLTVRTMLPEASRGLFKNSDYNLYLLARVKKRIHGTDDRSEMRSSVIIELRTS